MVLEFLGNGLGRELAKLKITPLDSSSNLIREKEIKVLFNPNSYTITKTISWDTAHDPNSSGSNSETQRNSNAPPLEFRGGSNRELTLELFFDVTENDNIGDVRIETNKVVALTRIDRDQGQPPICKVSWGEDYPKNSDLPFNGVVTSLTQNFTLFTFDGKPVRANLTVSFKEFLVPTDDMRDNDPEHSSWIIKRGDTLSSIAAEVYKNPFLWRLIAIENRLDDPRKLEVGKRLSLPRLR